MADPHGIAGTDATGASAPRSAACDDRDRALARRLTAAGLSAPAVLWLASLRPVSFLGGQALRLIEPLWDAVADADGLRHLIDVCEDRSRVDRLLDLLEVEAGGEAWS